MTSEVPQEVTEANELLASMAGRLVDDAAQPIKGQLTKPLKDHQREAGLTIVDVVNQEVYKHLKGVIKTCSRLDHYSAADNLEAVLENMKDQVRELVEKLDAERRGPKPRDNPSSN